MMSELGEKIIARADKDGLPAEHPLRVAAGAFNEAVASGAEPRKLLGAWARARRLWCEYSGEPLI